MTLNNCVGRGQVSWAEALSLVVRTTDPKAGDKSANQPGETPGEDHGGEAE
jgi:hypothetical protein